MSAETDQYFSLHAQSFLKYFSSVTSRSRVFVIFLKVLEPVSEKFGTEKVLESVSEKVWYQKSPGIGRRNIWSRSRNLPVSILSHLTFSKNITFCILSSEFWCWFGSWYRPRPFPGTFEFLDALPSLKPVVSHWQSEMSLLCQDIVLPLALNYTISEEEKIISNYNFFFILVLKLFRPQKLVALRQFMFSVSIEKNGENQEVFWQVICSRLERQSPHCGLNRCHPGLQGWSSGSN